MIINEGKKDGYDLVLHIPALKELGANRSASSLFPFFILTLAVSSGFGAAMNAEWVSFLGFSIALTAFIYVAVQSHRWRKENRGPLSALQSEVESILAAEASVLAKDRIKLGVGQTDFIAKEADGEDQFWDLIPLDDEGRIGLRSRFRVKV